MENVYGMTGALVGVAIIVVGFILVVVLGKIFHEEIQERQKEKLAKIKLDEFYQKEIDKIKKEKSKYDIREDKLLPLDCNKEKERIAELEIAINSEKERTKSLESTLRHNLATAAVFKDEAIKKEESSDIEKKELNSIVEELKLKLDKYETRRKPVKKRVSKYNNDNTLYVAYDFNILGNKSFAEVDKIIRDMLYGYRSGTVAIKTTSVVFFDIQYKTIFRDIVLINKKGGSISLSNLISNPKYYISDIDDLYNFQKVINENNTLAFTPKHLLSLVGENKINFKKEKEI